MDPRRFDALARSVGDVPRATSRRAVFAAFATLVGTAVAPRLTRADAGEIARPLAPGEIGCSSGADCPNGQICANGVCAPLPVGGAQTPAPPAAPAAPTPTPRAIFTPGEGTPVPIAETPAAMTPSPTAPSGVGGAVAADQPIPVGIFAGTCGSLPADAAFPLIDVGAADAAAAPAPPPGAPEADPSDFSASIVVASLESLLAAPHAIELRAVANDPATALACGQITGTLDTSGERPQLEFPLPQRNESGLSGTGLILDQDGRSLVYVFVTRPAAGEATAAQAAATPIPATTYRAGDRVVTLSDVNLRAAPSTEAAIVTVLGTGVELVVTVDPRDKGWLPVEEPASRQRGFVATETVEPAA